MIRKANLNDLPMLAQLVLERYPHYAADKTYYDLGKTMTADQSMFFLAFNEDIPVGYAQCQLRHDIVEGTETSPVGYLEGIYVKEKFRVQGYASRLMKACEQWAKEEGCIEFAGNCEVSDEEGHIFFSKLGFKEVKRIVCFAKFL